MITFAQSSTRNHLVATFPRRDFLTISPHFRPFELKLRTILHAPGELIDTVYFPELGYVSLIATLDEGDAAEVGVVGYEGMVGLPLILGSDRSHTEALVQGKGTALALDADVFRRVFDDSSSFRGHLLKYAMAFNVQLMMTAACNSRHLVEQRLARWLLMVDARSEGGSFAMTHEFLSLMLGVRRSGVTVAAGGLQKAGLIRYEKGRVEVTDRAGLEAAACNCERVARREYERLLGPLSPP